MFQIGSENYSCILATCFKCNLHLSLLSTRLILITPAPLCAFPPTQMGTVGGDFPTARELAQQTRCEHEHRHRFAFGLVSLIEALLLWECHEAVSRTRRLV